MGGKIFKICNRVPVECPLGVSGQLPPFFVKMVLEISLNSMRNWVRGGGSDKSSEKVRIFKEGGQRIFIYTPHSLYSPGHAPVGASYISVPRSTMRLISIKRPVYKWFLWHYQMD